MTWCSWPGTLGCRSHCLGCQPSVCSWYGQFSHSAQAMSFHVLSHVVSFLDHRSVQAASVVCCRARDHPGIRCQLRLLNANFWAIFNNDVVIAKELEAQFEGEADEEEEALAGYHRFMKLYLDYNPE